MRIAPLLLAGVALLSACGKASDNQTNATVDNSGAMEIEDVPVDEGPAAGGNNDMVADTAETDGWAGKWIGPEGLVLEIGKTGTPGTYDVKVTLLDGTGSYTGSAAGDAIRFTRDGTDETIRKASGDQTGLKYLAGKTNCLMIKQGEGFCRD